MKLPSLIKLAPSRFLIFSEDCDEYPSSIEAGNFLFNSVNIGYSKNTFSYEHDTLPP
jgi:hypothetical protein